jgi:L-ascorbate oxidase
VTSNPANPAVPRFVINGETYDPSTVPFMGVLGTVDQWTIKATAAGGHVFHIHVNPFRIMDIRNAAGDSIFDASGNCTQAEIATGDSQYCGMKGVIRDTVFVKPNYKIVMRTAYQDYTGKFVMHCHILDHEDQGMMANVAVVSPTTALLQRVSQQATRWFEGRQDKVETALSPICSANDAGQVVNR